MNRLKNFILTSVSFFLVLAFFIPHKVWAGPEIDTASNEIVRNVVNQAGSTATYTSYQLNNGLGEPGISSVTFSSYLLYPGLMNLESAPGAVQDLSILSVSSAAEVLSWSAPGYDGNLGNLQAGSSYHIQSSSLSAPTWNYASAQVIISTHGVSPGNSESADAPGLLANTTYSFTLWTLDAQGNLSAISNHPSAVTLAQAPQSASPTFLAVYVSSADVQWTALPTSPPSATSEGYVLEASTMSDFSGTPCSSSTSNVSLNQLTVKCLNSDTTYYFRVGSLNWIGGADYTSIGSTLTLTSTDLTPPDAVTNLSASTDTASSVLLSWSVPLEPNDNPLSGKYNVQYETYTTGVVWSTGSAQVTISTSGVMAGTTVYSAITGLDANTTYYFYLWSANVTPVWSPLSNGATVATLANGLSNLTLVSVSSNSTSLSWTALPLTPSSSTSEGYLTQASTASDFSGTIHSSATSDDSLNALSILGLSANTTYYLRAGPLNLADVPNFTTLGSTSTLATPVSNSRFLNVYLNSVTLAWTALPASPQSATSEGYEADASTAPDFSGTVFFSSTTNVLDSTLTISNLSQNVTYYFKVGSLDLDGAENDVSLGSTSTLAALPTIVSPAFTMVGVDSATVQWGANGNSASTQYLLKFTGTLFSSNTLNASATLTGLSANTTYYAEVEAINNDGIATGFVSLASTMTQASQPQAPSSAFSPVYVTSLTVSFLNGSPANPTGTFYDVQLSTDPAFSVYSDSLTVNLSAAFIGLSINTTYYAQVAAENGQNVFSPYASLNSTSTLAVPPGTLTQTYSNLTASAFTLSWTSGTPTTGYNPDGTTYEAQAALNNTFTSGVIDLIVSTNSANFSGLISGTQYFTRVQTLNWQDIPTGYVTYGSTTTLPSSAPSFLNGTFEISNAAGAFQTWTPTIYTDTITPNLQIQLQSNYTPGLSVTDTPSQLALWHMDENTGTTSQDSSTHAHTLTLSDTGGHAAPSWTTGELGSGVQFAGTSNTVYNYAISSSLQNGWRSTTGINNEWTINLWFKTATSGGYLFQTTNSPTPGGASVYGYDAEISWSHANGKLAFAVRQNNTTTVRVINASSIYNDGAWHFVSAVLNTSGMYLYVDGSLAISGTAVNSNTAQLYTGAIYAWVGGGGKVDGTNMSANAFYDGDEDEVLIDTVPMTAQQIAAEYALTSNETHELGAPSVDISTQAGNSNAWVRFSTSAFQITGTNGTTAAQIWSSTFSIANLSLVQSTAAAAPTDQVMFLASSLDSNETTTQFTILVDTTPPAVPAFSALSAPTTYSLTVNSLSGSDALSGLPASPFDVQASTDINFGVVNADSGFIAGPNFIFTTLWANTTYYVRTYEEDNAGNISGYSASQALATLAVVPSTNTAPFLDVYFTSATVGWNALPLSPPAASSMSAEGYELDASTAPDFSGTIYSSVTTNVLDSTLSVTGLSLNTTVYFRIGSINHAGTPNYTGDIPLIVSLSTSVATISINMNNIMSIVAASSVTITNTGNIPETVLINGSTETAGTPWSLGVSSAIEVAVLQGLWNSTQPASSSFSTAITTTTRTSQVGGNYAGNQNGFELSIGQSVTLWLQFWRPTSSSVLGTQVLTIYFTPVYP